MPGQPDTDYYLSRRKRLLSLFDRLGRRMRVRLAERTGTGQAQAIVDDARRELESILPELPFIGGNRNVFTWVIVANSYIIALHRAMKRRGLEARETVAVCVEVTDELLRKVPPRHSASGRAPGLLPAFASFIPRAGGAFTAAKLSGRFRVHRA